MLGLLVGEMNIAAAQEEKSDAFAQFEELDSPDETVLEAKERVLATAEQAVEASDNYLKLAGEAADAEEARDAAQLRALKAEQRVSRARSQLGEYAAGAYINGGEAASTSASLEAGDPTELVSRQNTLASVGETSTELVDELREAEAEAATARQEAEEAAETARVALSAATAASRMAVFLSERAEELFAEIVDEALTEQKRVEEELLRAQMAAAGSGAWWVKAAPPELLVYGNGQIPTDALTPLKGFKGHYLWEDAAIAFELLMAAAKDAGITIGVTDSYRTYESQVRLAKTKGLYAEGGLAARPGTSNHGWGTALDLRLDSKALAWMRAEAFKYGYVEDVPREPWHWHYVGLPSATGTTDGEATDKETAG